MSKSVRILIACAVGAFIGSIVALQMYQMFWWVGAIIGAFVAYLGYNIEEVIAAIPVAYRAARGWRPDTEAWKVKFSTLSGVVGQAQTTCVAIFLLFLPATFADITPNGWRIIGIVFLVMNGVGVLVGLMLPARDHQGRLISSPFTYKTSNPVSALFWYLPKGIWWLVSRTPSAFVVSIKALATFGSFLKRFGLLLFREIHSDIRLLCACDAALGTTVGYLTGSPIIGAVAGGFLGVLNYEIITVRVMKLAGAKSMFK